MTSPTGYGDSGSMTALSSDTARLSSVGREKRTGGEKEKVSAKVVRVWLWRIQGKHDQTLVQARSGQELSTDGGEAQELRGMVG